MRVGGFLAFFVGAAAFVALYVAVLVEPAVGAHRVGDGVAGVVVGAKDVGADAIHLYVAGGDGGAAHGVDVGESTGLEVDTVGG